MKGMLSAPDIYLYRESVDFRKSINGLAAIIENDKDLPLGSGALFLFTNKQRDKIKVLYWDKTGFALWYKRLEKAKIKKEEEESGVEKKTELVMGFVDEHGNVVTELPDEENNELE